MRKRNAMGARSELRYAPTNRTLSPDCSSFGPTAVEEAAAAYAGIPKHTPEGILVLAPAAQGRQIGWTTKADVLRPENNRNTKKLA